MDIKKAVKTLNRFNNTTVTVDGETVTVTLHGTDIFRYDMSTGQIDLNTGGWVTVTTAKRMNEAFRAFDLPFTVGRRDGRMKVWNVRNWNEDADFYRETVLFVD